MSRPDLTTVSIGAERKRWIRENGFELSRAVQRMIDTERGIALVVMQTHETKAAIDASGKDPADHLPEPPPAGPHGWTRQGARHIARPASLDELARLVSTAPGPVRLAASHVLIVAEVNDG